MEIHVKSAVYSHTPTICVTFNSIFLRSKLPKLGGSRYVERYPALPFVAMTLAVAGTTTWLWYVYSLILLIWSNEHL